MPELMPPSRIPGARALGGILTLGLALAAVARADGPPLPAGAPAAGQAALVASEETWSFGEVEQGIICERTIELYNRGALPIEITRVAPSCGCTTAKLESMSIAAGEKRPLKVTFDTHRRRGAQGGHIQIESTDRARPAFTLSFSAVVDAPPQPIMRVIPHELELGLLVPGREPRGTVEVENGGQRDLVISELRPSPGMDLDRAMPLPVTVAAGAKLELPVRLKPHPTHGIVRETLLIVSNDVTFPNFGLSIMAYAPGDATPILEVLPSLWDFGVVPAASTTTARVTIANAGRADLRIEAIRTSDPISVALPTPLVVGPGKSAEFVLGLANAQLHAGKAIDRYLWIVSNDPRTSQRSFEVTGYIEPVAPPGAPPQLPPAVPPPVAPQPAPPPPAAAPTPDAPPAAVGQATPSPAPALAAATPVRTVRLAVSGDRRGEIEPCQCAEGRLGGFARELTILDGYRAAGLGPLVLGSGDLVGPPEPHFELRAEVALDAMSAAGYGAVTLGEAELRFGPERLRRLVERARFPVVSANVLDAATGKPFTGRRFVVLENGGARVAVTGVLAAEYPFAPAGEGPRFRVEDPVATLAALVPEMRKAADTVVVLAHVGREGALGLAARVPDIDVLVVGHGSESPETIERAGNGPVVIENSDKGKFVYRVDLGVAAAAPHIVSASLERLALSPGVGADGRVEAILAAYRAQLVNLAPPAVETPGAPRFAGASSCLGCHAAAAAVWQRSDHAHALATLDKVDHGYEPECVKCHVAGYGLAGGFRTRALTPDLGSVQCESCHGPGADHVARPAKGYGRVTAPEQCLRCHTPDNSPRFNLGSYWAKVKH